MIWLGGANVRLEMSPVDEATCHATSSAKGLKTRSHWPELLLIRGSVAKEMAESSVSAGAVDCMRAIIRLCVPGV
jgi:hypothetical protein